MRRVAWLIAGALLTWGGTATADELPGDAAEIRKLTPPQARKLVAECRGPHLFLPDLTTLDAATAESLAEFAGHSLFLNGLTELDADAAEALAKFGGGGLFLPGLTRIDAATAEALGASMGWSGQLPNVTAIDLPTAKALAKFQCKGLHHGLRLGLTQLDAATAEALAEFKGGLLAFDRLQTLAPASARALARFQGHLDLSGLTGLEPQTAEALAAFAGGSLYLDGLTAFDGPDSLAVAKALASRAGPLSLAGLEKISPKSLTALLEKRDVAIPLIENLELIPEPDGSPNVEFVVPQWLRERQKGRR